jgi:hypothetical protein
MIRKSLLLVSVLLLKLNFLAFADEGMWLPLFLKELNEKDMKANGMKISADDIYNVNQSSLKDAIVSFGGFCTGEVISSRGLVLTNHHCGYGQIQSHSSVQNDLLTEGYWAMTPEQELPNPGLFVTFIVRIEDVTKQVLEGIDHKTSEAEREALIKQRTNKIASDAVKGSHYGASIKPFFYGNEYYMFVTETFKDIRLVGAPPSSIGKFGGDTDNWMWTRHTGDFSLFRIYAGPDGKPAEYSRNNVPYQPKHHLPVNLNGINPDDFTMVFGFPGRTTEYLTSFAVNTIIEETNPHRIKIRDKKLAILNEDMKKSDAVRIQYASKYASTANAWKKWIGENRGLARLNAIGKKRELEAKFDSWANENPARKEKYGDVIKNFEMLYKLQNTINLANTYTTEAVYGTEVLRFGRYISPLANPNLSEEERQKLVERVKAYAEGYFKDYNTSTDRKVFSGLLSMYVENVDEKFIPASLISELKKRKGNFNSYSSDLFKRSLLVDQDKFNRYIHSFNSKSVAQLKSDPAFVLMEEFSVIFDQKIKPVFVETEEKIEKLQRLYLAGLREMQPEKKFYPDANSTLRVAFGKVSGYKPRDGVNYQHYTTLEGIIEKEDPTNDEFIVPDKLKRLYTEKDYGIYGQNGVMPVCFIASNHTTGGNSGSPVINAEGHLIGTNFDRNWEGTMSDIMYDPDMCRNIAVDIRYTLFIIDKFAGAGHLVDEMTIIKYKDLNKKKIPSMELVD